MADPIYTQGMLGLGLGSFGAGTEGMLGNKDFTEYLELKGLDTNRLTAPELSARYKEFTTTPGMMDGVYDKIGGVFGGTGQDVKDIGGALGDVAGFGNMLYGMYNQKQMLDTAKDQYGFQKGMAQAQWNEAMKDKAEFKANRSAATKKYYGQ